ncbi:FecR family protein [Allomuricauda sp. F6463D]|uniref:FecR family protein n=1 Tax=Allomuricauda sp. F6463D TaxID=2926409 RepID=UPI001FF149CB|nr:FecR domain-containing protein [Muricauda sp. F6463D]MCK0159198.1 DUF4974 domain-containing protein [Muricauda sp. F6463D]
MGNKKRLRLQLTKLRGVLGLKGKPDKDLEKNDQELFDAIVNNNLVDESLSFLDELDVEKDWKKVEKILFPSKVHKIWSKNVFKYAAIFLGVFSLSLSYLWISKVNSKGDDNIHVGDFVTLDIGGEIIAIDNHGSHSIELPTGAKVAVHNGDTLIYEVGEQISESIFNELHVPNGKIFTLVLSDGTEIKLNSGSNIRFPVKFPAVGNREVYIYGEAYFDVSKDSVHPFVVNSEDMAVKVLGTEFNFSTYNEQKKVATVLVEGSVSLRHGSSLDEEVLLVPGEKGSWDREEQKIAVNKVDTNLYTSWTIGEIVIRDTPFSELMANLERVYNVKIQNTNKEITQRTFNARFNRNIEDVEDVLEALKLIVPFDYEIYRENARINQITIK